MEVARTNYFISAAQRDTLYSIETEAARARIHAYATLLDEAKEYQCAKLQCCLYGSACSFASSVICNTPLACILGELATCALSRRLTLEQKVNETREAVKTYILENPFDFPKMTPQERQRITASWKRITLDLPEMRLPRAQPTIQYLQSDPLLSDQEEHWR